MLRHLFFWGIQCLQAARRGAQGKRTLTTPSSADCSMLSPAVPSAAPPPSTWGRVAASQVPFPQASGRRASGGFALESRVLFQEPSMAKQDTLAAARLQVIFVSCNFPLPALGCGQASPSPWQVTLPTAPALHRLPPVSPAWAQEETLCLQWGAFQIPDLCNYLL